jgi:hypothetical protein
MKGPPPRRELVNFLPIDIFVVESVAFARIGGELRPQILDLASFGDALP